MTGRPLRRVKDDGPRPPYSDDFLMFWEAYPRKEAKQIAWDSYRAALKRGHKCGLLIMRAEQFAKSDVGMGVLKFIPHAATWLNQDRFLDDPERWNDFGKFGDNHAKSNDPSAVTWNYKG